MTCKACHLVATNRCFMVMSSVTPEPIQSCCNLLRGREEGGRLVVKSSSSSSQPESTLVDSDVVEVQVLRILNQLAKLANQSPGR